MALEFVYDKRDYTEQKAISRASFILALREGGIMDIDLLRAMELIPREVFTPIRYRDLARSNVALPLPCGQIMTNPLTIAHMLFALKVEPGNTVLEVGTGSGYVSALLAQLGCQIITIERHLGLKNLAETVIDALDFSQSIQFIHGDGLRIKKSKFLFDRILLNGSLKEIPKNVQDRLSIGGKLVGASQKNNCEPVLTIMDRLDKDHFEIEEGLNLHIGKLVSNNF